MQFPSAKAAAQFYQFEHGWSVMPIGRPTDRGEPKAPYLGAGEIIPLRTNALDVDGITAVWSMFPQAGVAVLTGKLSNLSVIDVDFDKKIEGVPAPDSKLAYHGDIPTNTLTARTGSGGLHFFFKHSPKADGRKELRPHIDLKSEGGYIILPPSIHKSGRQYEWLNDLPIADFPEHLLENRIQSQRSVGSARSYWDKLIHGLAEGEDGGRNNYMASVAGTCFKNNISVEDAIKFLIPFGQVCKPPVDLETIERTVRSAYNTALRRQEKPEEVTEDDTIEIVDLWQAADEVQGDVGVARFPLGIYGCPRRPLNDPGSVFVVEPDPITEALGGGMSLGDLGVVSGHTGSGKTFLAGIITQSLGAQAEKSLWLEFELLPPELRDRFINLGIEKGQVFVPRDKETKNLDGSMEFVEGSIIKAQKETGVRFIFLDLLDRFRPRNDKEKKAVNTNLSAYLALICEQLKDLAIKHKVVIILMAHTRKPPSGFSKKAPDLHDIINSAGIAQNADWVLMIHRKTKKEMAGISTTEDTKKSMRQARADSRETEEEGDLSDTSRITLQKNRRTGKFASAEIRYNQETGEIKHGPEGMSQEAFDAYGK
jgi:hypothetical protein